MQLVQPPVIEQVGALVRDHPGTISLGQGVVYYGPPQAAIDQLTTFLANPNNHKYQAFQGLPQLLELLTAKLRAENGIMVDDSNEVIVTAGSNMAFMNAVLAIADPGDEFIIQSPYYFNHEMAIRMASCVPVVVPTDENYQLRPDAIRAAITPRTRAIVTISPNNPTGAVYPPSVLAEINTLCRERGVFHISDEAYEYFTWDGARHFSAASLPGASAHTISLYSLSKAYGFASWRIGYMVAPKSLTAAIKKIQDTMLICPPVVSQYAAIGALETGPEYCREKLRVTSEIRGIVQNELRAIADFCVVPPADGAFYFLLRLDSEMEPMPLVRRLVSEHGVAAIPGMTFGLAGCYLRLAYGVLQKETAAEGIGRLTHGLRTILKG
ncbi:MAG: pyridoxal phosphate-dependent aminotransferase [Blastocatellia bacterium]